MATKSLPPDRLSFRFQMARTLLATANIPGLDKKRAIGFLDKLDKGREKMRRSLAEQARSATKGAR
jgi:hypothetical protein